MNAKIYNGNVQPNHKEYKIWVNDEGVIKTWNGTEWVEQSGGSGESGGGSSSGGKWEYLNIEGLNTNVRNNLVVYGVLIKTIVNGDKVILHSSSFIDSGLDYSMLKENAKAVFINLDLKGSDPIGEFSVKDVLLSLPFFSQEILDNIPRISEQEFYSFE